MVIGEIKKWRGLRNNDTGKIDGGYLFFITDINKDEKGSIIGYRTSGIKIDGVSNRSQAIKKYKANPSNPNNYKKI